MTQTKSTKDLILYAMLAMPLAFAGIPIYIYVPDFYATEFALSLDKIALILLAVRAFDAVQDPWIGYLSDRYHEHRLLFIKLFSFILTIGFILLFYPLIDNLIIWLALMIVITSTTFSFLTINLNSLGGLWQQNHNFKTVIAGYRESFAIVGLILANILPNILQINLNKQQAFIIIGLIFAVLMLLALFLFIRWYQKTSHNFNQKFYERIQLKDLKRLPRRLKKFFFIYTLSIFASSIPAVLVLFFIRDLLQLEHYTGLFLMTYFIAGILGIYLWYQLSVKIGKHQTWLMAMIVAVLSFFWAYFLEAGDFWSYLIICLVSGVAFGCEITMPASILADQIQEQKAVKKSTLYFGILAFLSKLALALASIALIYLQWSGFKAAAVNTKVALSALSISYALIPCIIKLLSIYFLRRYVYEINQSHHWQHFRS